MKILAAVSPSYGAGSRASMSAPVGSYVTRGYSRDVEQVKMSRQMHDNRRDSMAVATPEAAAASWYMLRIRVYTYVYTAIRYPCTRIPVL